MSTTDPLDQREAQLRDYVDGLIKSDYNNQHIYESLMSLGVVDEDALRLIHQGRLRSQRGLTPKVKSGDKLKSIELRKRSSLTFILIGFSIACFGAIISSLASSLFTTISSSQGRGLNVASLILWLLLNSVFIAGLCVIFWGIWRWATAYAAFDPTHHMPTQNRATQTAEIVPPDQGEMTSDIPDDEHDPRTPLQ